MAVPRSASAAIRTTDVGHLSPTGRSCGAGGEACGSTFQCRSPADLRPLDGSSGARLPVRPHGTLLPGLLSIQRQWIPSWRTDAAALIALGRGVGVFYIVRVPDGEGLRFWKVFARWPRHAGVSAQPPHPHRSGVLRRAFADHHPSISRNAVRAQSVDVS